MLKDCLFKAVKLTKNAESDKYFYLRYDNFFRLQLLTRVNILLFLELIIVLPCILIIGKKIS